MLIGDPAARKSTTIKLARKLLTAGGYFTFAADKSSKEKFLTDLATDSADDIGGSTSYSAAQGSKTAAWVKYDDITSSNLWGTTGSSGERLPKEVFISADEFNDFAGVGNLEFFTTLGTLWDWDDETKGYTSRFKSGSIDIFQPTVSLLGGNTQENFARAFPPEIIGQGFLSRLILIYGQRTGRKIAFPEAPPECDTVRIVEYFSKIREFYSKREKQELKISADARTLLAAIYEEWIGVGDIRFATYNQRRFTQLLKLCLILSGSKFHKELVPEVVVEANTYLAAAELLMPEALGEFGKSKHSDISNKIMKMLEEAHKPVDIHELWKHVQKDLNGMKDLGEIIQSLEHAGKVQLVKSKGWLPKKEAKKKQEYVDWNLLTDEERSNL